TPPRAQPVVADQSRPRGPAHRRGADARRGSGGDRPREGGRALGRRLPSEGCRCAARAAGSARQEPHGIRVLLDAHRAEPLGFHLPHLAGQAARDARTQRPPLRGDDGARRGLLLRRASAGAIPYCGNSPSARTASRSAASSSTDVASPLRTASDDSRPSTTRHAPSTATAGNELTSPAGTAYSPRLGSATETQSPSGVPSTQSRT